MHSTFRSASRAPSPPPLASSITSALRLITVGALTASLLSSTLPWLTAPAWADDGPETVEPEDVTTNVHPRQRGTGYVATTNYDPAHPESGSYFVHTLEAGEVGEDAVRVGNMGDVPIRMYLYPADGFTSPTTGVAFTDRDVPVKGVGSWLEFGAGEIALAGGESQVIPFRVLVPHDTASGQYVGGLVAQDVIEEEGSGEMLGVRIRSRVVLAVVVTVPGELVPKLSISGVSVGGDTGFPRLLLDVDVLGNRLTKASGDVVVVDGAGRERLRQHLELDTMLPRDRISYPVPMTAALEPGEYQVKANLEYSDEPPATLDAVLVLSRDDATKLYVAPTPVAIQPVVAGFLEPTPAGGAVQTSETSAIGAGGAAHSSGDMAPSIWLVVGGFVVTALLASGGGYLAARRSGRR